MKVLSIKSNIDYGDGWKTTGYKFNDHVEVARGQEVKYISLNPKWDMNPVKKTAAQKRYSQS